MEKEEQKKGFKQRAEGENVDFTVYAEVYGKDKMLCKVYADFTGNVEELTARNLRSIAEYLEIKSGINHDDIDHTVLQVDFDNDLNEEIEREESDDEEEPETENENGGK